MVISYLVPGVRVEAETDASLRGCSFPFLAPRTGELIVVSRRRVDARVSFRRFGVFTDPQPVFPLWLAFT